MSSATCALLNTNRVVDPRPVLPSVGDRNQRFDPNAAAKYRCLFAAELKYDGRPLVRPLATRYVPSKPPVVPLMIAAPQIGHACVLQLIVTVAATIITNASPAQASTYQVPLRCSCFRSHQTIHPSTSTEQPDAEVPRHMCDCTASTHSAPMSTWLTS